MNRKLYTIGETVLDMMFKNDQPVAAKAGGSMLNTSVSLGRLGEPVYFMSEIGADQVGDMIVRFLESNGVKTEFIYRYTQGKTALAMAFLNEENNASYDFYKLYPPERLAIDFPQITQNDLVFFGSFYGIAPELQPKLKKFLTKAKQEGALVYYDPNFRKSHLHELEQLRPLIIENMSLATVVRCSNEDMELIAGVETPEKTYRFIEPYCKNVIYTNSTKGVHILTPKFQLKFPVKSITPVSTIGAGDTFNAGIAFGMMKLNINAGNISEISEKQWETIVSYGVDFATEVCLSYDNYISQEFAGQLLNKLSC